MPYREKGWELKPVDDEYTLPLEIRRRIRILRNKRVPIKQVLIAHELPIEVEAIPIPESPPIIEVEPISEPTKRTETHENEKDVSEPASGKEDALTSFLVGIGKFALFLLVCGLVLVGASLLLMAVFQYLIPIAVFVAVFMGILTPCITDPICVVILNDGDQSPDGKDSWLMIGMWYQ